MLLRNVNARKRRTNYLSTIPNNLDVVEKAINLLDTLKKLQKSTGAFSSRDDSSIRNLIGEPTFTKEETKSICDNYFATLEVLFFLKLTLFLIIDYLN